MRGGECSRAAGEEGYGSKIAVISLRGIITSAEPGAIGETMVDDLKLQLGRPAEDDEVKAVVLYVDSPGGEVTASDTIYMAVKRMRDQSKKPVVVYMGSLAASGGYYVACGGDYIMANETTLTGSIGVIMQTLNYRELMGKVGPGAGHFQERQDEGHAERRARNHGRGARVRAGDGDADLRQVRRHRGARAQAGRAGLRNGVADGRVLSGKDAMANKLMDGLGEVEDAYAKAMELAGAKGALVVRYETQLQPRKAVQASREQRERKAKVEVNLTEGRSRSSKPDACTTCRPSTCLNRHVDFTLTLDSPYLFWLGLLSVLGITLAFWYYGQLTMRLQREGGEVRPGALGFPDLIVSIVLGGFLAMLAMVAFHQGNRVM